MKKTKNISKLYATDDAVAIQAGFLWNLLAAIIFCATD